MANLIFNIKILAAALIILLCFVSIKGDCLEANKPISKIKSESKTPLIQQGVVMQHDCKDGSNIVSKMLAAANNINSYSCNYQMLVFKNNPPIKETGVMYFRKPRLYRVEVKEGPKKGSIAVLCADGKVHGHLGGWLKYFQSAVPPDSDLAKASNGFPMAGTDYISLAQYLTNMLKQGNNSLVSLSPITTAKTTMDTYVLDMYSGSDNKTGKTEPLLIKRVYINPQNYLPVDWEDYRKGKLWSESSWNGLQINSALPDDLFQL